MLDILVLNTWLIAVLWAALYIFDYASTLWLAGVYRTTLSKYIVLRGRSGAESEFRKRDRTRAGSESKISPAGGTGPVHCSI